MKYVHDIYFKLFQAFLLANTFYKYYTTYFRIIISCLQRYPISNLDINHNLSSSIFFVTYIIQENVYNYFELSLTLKNCIGIRYIVFIFLLLFFP